MPTTQKTAITENGAANDYLPTFAQQVNALAQEVRAAIYHIKNHCDVTRPSPDCDFCRGAGARE